MYTPFPVETGQAETSRNHGVWCEAVKGHPQHRDIYHTVTQSRATLSLLTDLQLVRVMENPGWRTDQENNASTQAIVNSNYLYNTKLCIYIKHLLALRATVAPSPPTLVS